MDNIRTAALAAVAEVGPAWNGQAKVIQATKLVRDRTDCDLHAAIDAVKWAIDRPAAATLPVNSIVASPVDAYIKPQGREDGDLPWAVTGVSGWHYSDDEIDAMLRADQAAILRVGDGAS